ncbi:MAG: radical SAM protein, partial [Bdellovibrionota bacterium]
MKTPVNAILSPLQVQPAAESVKTDQPRVGIRRYGDIVAFPDGEGSYTAFHARNLEVADIPKEIWNEMQETTFVEALPLRLLKNPESEDAVDLKTWEEELNPETTTQRISSQIRALTINTTQICNLACAYCAAGGDGTYNDAVKNISVEKTLPQIKFFIDRLPAHGTFQIIFLGGEPLLHPQGLVAIGTYAQELCKEKEINLSVKIITNGTLITEAIVESLKPLRPGWNISIDGPNEINDVVRPSKNGKPSTPQTLKGLELLVSNKSNWNGISLHAVFNKHNPDVFSTYMFFRELGVDYFELTLDVFESDPEMTAQYISGMNKVAEHAFTNGGEEALRKILTFDSFFESLGKFHSHLSGFTTAIDTGDKNILDFALQSEEWLASLMP